MFREKQERVELEPKLSQTRNDYNGLAMYKNEQYQGHDN
jgi:hypothetical protein